MKTSGLAGQLRSDRAAQRRPVGARYPISAAIGALELGAGEQLGELGVVAGGNQAQAVEHAGNCGAPGRERVAVADEAGNAQGRLIDGLEKPEAGSVRSG